MSTKRIPHTDSIQELAQFWDTHDLTDFEADLEEVEEPVFERETEVKVPLPSREAKTVAEMAQSQGIGLAQLIREWVLERIHTSS